MHIEPLGQERRTHAPADGIARLLRQALVRADRCWPDDQEMRDCAELLLALGHADEARMLHEALFIEGGFSGFRTTAQVALAERTGLWDPAGWPPASEGAATTTFAFRRAADELRRLMATPLPDQHAGASPQSPAPIEILPEPSEVAAFVSGLCRALRGPTSAALGMLLDRARTLIAEPPAVTLVDHLAAGSVAELAATVAVNRLRRFLIANHGLAFAPLGSPELLVAAARLEEGGLSPYFRNLRLLIRGAQDVIGLVRLAGGEGDDLERWCVLLAAHLGEPDRMALADALGDLGLTGGLRGLLDDALRRGDDRGIFWTIRDAALDLGEPGLAVDAQRATLPFERHGTTEMVVLAEILATAGDGEAAEATLRDAIRRSPRDRGARRRLVALLRGHFGPYLAQQGFGSSPARAALRRATQATG